MAPTPSPWPFPWPLVQGDLDFTLPPLSGGDDDAGHHHQQQQQGDAILLGESYAAMSGMVGDETVRGGKPIFAGRAPCDLDFPAGPLAAPPLPKSARRAKKTAVSGGGVRKVKSQENITQSPAAKAASAKAASAGKKASARKKKGLASSPSSSSWSAGSDKSGETKFIGISQYRRKKWEAHVWAKGGTPEGGEKGRQLHLGYFTSPVNAARAYDRAALFLRGPADARLNFGASVYAEDAIMSQLKQVKREDFLTKLRALSADEEERDTQSASTYTTGAMDLGPASAGLSQQRRGMSFRSDATVKGGVPKGRRGKQTKAPDGPGRSGTSKQGQRTKALAKVEEEGRSDIKALPGMGISPNTTLLGIPLFTYTGESGLGDHYLSMRSHIPITQRTSAGSGWALSDQASRLSLHHHTLAHHHQQQQQQQQQEVPDYLVAPPGLPLEPFEAIKEFLHSEVGTPVSCAMTGEASVSGTGSQPGIFDDQVAQMTQMTQMGAAEIMGAIMEASAVTMAGTGHQGLSTDTQGSIGNYTFFDAL